MASRVHLGERATASPRWGDASGASVRATTVGGRWWQREGLGGGASELIEDGRNGMRCDPDDPEGIRRALIQLSRFPDNAAELRRAARETVVDQSWDRCAKQTRSVYETALQERHP